MSEHQAGCTAHGAPVVLRVDDVQGRPMARISADGCIAWSVDPMMADPDSVRAIEREANVEATTTALIETLLLLTPVN